MLDAEAKTRVASRADIGPSESIDVFVTRPISCDTRMRPDSIGKVDQSKRAIGTVGMAVAEETAIIILAGGGAPDCCK